MQGTWKHKNSTADRQGVLGYIGGKATLNFNRQIVNNTESTYVILELFNGNYIDHGYVQAMIPIEAFEGKYTHVKGNYTFYLDKESPIRYNYVVKLEVLVN